MAAREWYWWIEREQTQVVDMYRVTVTVAASEDEEKSPLVTLVGFIAPTGSAVGDG